MDIEAELEREAREAIWEEEGRQLRETGFASLVEHFETLLYPHCAGARIAAFKHLHAEALKENEAR